jgi:hypothetical protein
MGCGWPRALPLLQGAPGGPQGLAAWGEYVRDGRLSGMVTWLPP